ncbi:MAG TPA: hypothetical protein VFG46_11070 [Chryseolinea sp.]|nr:hypothetical protein [Chryseolinea sp.]
MCFHDRLKELILREGKMSAFEEKLGFSNRSLAGAIETKRGINSDRLEKIFETYPNWSPTWLFTGKGEMYLTPTNLTLLDDLATRVKTIEETIAAIKEAEREQELKLSKGCPAYVSEC